MSAAQYIQVAVLAIIKMAKIFGCCILIAVAITIATMTILKQCFGISTRKLVRGFLGLEKK